MIIKSVKVDINKRSCVMRVESKFDSDIDISKILQYPLST